jgi:hypothetical protein
MWVVAFVLMGLGGGGANRFSGKRSVLFLEMPHWNGAGF